MTAHIYIIGFVQGVGYRRFLQSKAKKLGLKGWVRNTNDGRVEAIVQGNVEVIEKLVSILKKGNMLSDVKSIQFEWLEFEEQFYDFRILF